MLACVLAGGESFEFSPEGKAFARIHGKTMLEYVTDALAEVPAIDRIVVINDHGSLINSLHEALKQGGERDEYVLIVTCDVPFLTKEAVEDFLERCRSDADLYYPIVNKKDYEQRFPGSRRTYVRLREGTFTGGNLFLLRPYKIIPLLGRIEKLLELRKSPLALSAELGFSFVLRLLLTKLTGFLTIEKLEHRVAEMFDLRARAVISPFPEIANDIDKSDDLEWAKKMLSG